MLAMLADFKLPLHPTVTDCLKWSGDGELAIAAGEFVHLLVMTTFLSLTDPATLTHHQVPKRGDRRGHQKNFKSDPWVHVNFRINSYSRDEWPSQQLSDLDSLSIGEEQSLSTVVALEWSPHGLAKHRRSVLAVLTTNHILSLWASASDPKIACTWQRVLVVNQALDGFYQQTLSDGEHGSPDNDRRRHFARVRSMSWALPKPLESSNSGSNHDGDASEGSISLQYLAVTNDADEVAILKIKSPWLHHESSVWEAHVVSRASWVNLKLLLTTDQETGAIGIDDSTMTGANEAQRPSRFVYCMREKAFIDQVICIPCQNQQADLGLILQKSGRTLRVEISYYVNLGPSVTEQWMPLSFFRQRSPSNLYFPSLECGSATLQQKVFSYLLYFVSIRINVLKTRTSPSYTAIANAGIVEVFLFRYQKGATNDACTRTTADNGARILQLTDEWDHISGNFPYFLLRLKRIDLTPVRACFHIYTKW